MNQLSKILVATQVGRTIEFEGIKIKPLQSTYACNDCIFETPDKAFGCKYKGACMAHLRKDKESVVFANGTTK